LNSPVKCFPDISDYRRATVEGGKRIERQFEKGKPREDGRAVDAEFNVIPAVIQQIEEMEFKYVLAHLEQRHQLLAWTPGYIVKLAPPVCTHGNCAR